MQTRLKNALFIYATSHQRYGLRSKHCHLSKQMQEINVENILPLFGRKARSSNIDSFRRICRLSSVVIQFIDCIYNLQFGCFHLSVFTITLLRNWFCIDDFSKFTVANPNIEQCGTKPPISRFWLLQFENHFGGLISLYSYFYLFKINCYDILFNLSAVLVNIVTGTNIPKIFSAHLAYGVPDGSISIEGVKHTQPKHSTHSPIRLITNVSWG